MYQTITSEVAPLTSEIGSKRGVPFFYRVATECEASLDPFSISSTGISVREDVALSLLWHWDNSSDVSTSTPPVLGLGASRPNTNVYAEVDLEKKAKGSQLARSARLFPKAMDGGRRTDAVPARPLMTI